MQDTSLARPFWALDDDFPHLVLPATGLAAACRAFGRVASGAA